jgi:ubiquinone/menaquinone biosynthesis C-methylase UbiE
MPTEQPRPGSREFYERDAETYEQSRFRSPGGRCSDARQGALLEEAVADWRGKRVLEVGCGTGRITTRLAEWGADLTALDIAEAMLRQVRAKFGRPGSGRVPAFVQGSALELPFSDNSFEVVVSINVLSHVPQMRKVIAEMARVLAPGGSLLVNFTNARSLYWPAALYVNARGKAVGLDVYTHWYRPGEVWRALRQAGLQATRLSGQVHVPRAVPRAAAAPLIWTDRLLGESCVRGWCPTLFVAAVKPRPRAD